MSDAAWLPSSDASQRARTKSNYFAKLVSLYSYWCYRLFKGGAEERRPSMVGIACLGDIILLSCSIPTIPGNVDGKETIRLSRFADLQGRGRQEGSNKQVLDLTKVQQIKFSYGNCAETWGFALLCLQ